MRKVTWSLGLPKLKCHAFEEIIGCENKVRFILWFSNLFFVSNIQKYCFLCTFVGIFRIRTMLYINNACIAYGTEVLFSGFNMKLEKGETACIAGQSGCGKTSLLNAIMGFVPLKEGSIKVGETLLSKSTIDAVRRQIAWIPQELALPFEWVREMVALPFDLKVNCSVPFSEERLFRCFDELGLEHELYAKRVNEVSGGQRQRIMLAVAAMLNKPLIIIDEPTSALDAGTTDKVLSFFRRQAEKGAAVLAVSHDKDFASGCHYLIEL